MVNQEQNEPSDPLKTRPSSAETAMHRREFWCPTRAAYGIDMAPAIKIRKKKQQNVISDSANTSAVVLSHLIDDSEPSCK